MTRKRDLTLAECVALYVKITLRNRLDEHDWHRINTAESLGITREWLYKLMLRHGLQPTKGKTNGIRSR